MDGILNYLEPYIGGITDAVIPKFIHNYYDKLFINNDVKSIAPALNDVLVTHDNVKALLELKKDEADDLDKNVMGYLMKIVENAVKENMLAMNFNNPNSQSINTLCSDTESCSSDNLYDEEIFVAGDNLEDEDVISGNQITKNTTVQHILPDVKTDEITNNSAEDKVYLDVTADPLKDFLMKYNNNDEADIKEYFKDLGEVLCLRLTLEKRKIFLSRVDLIVSEIFER